MVEMAGEQSCTVAVLQVVAFRLFKELGDIYDTVVQYKLHQVRSTKTTTGLQPMAPSSRFRRHSGVPEMCLQVSLPRCRLSPDVTVMIQRATDVASASVKRGARGH